MDLQLKDKLAFVSGSSEGIGQAIALALASEGARVIVNGRRAAGVADALARLREAVPDAEPQGFVGDLTDPDTIARAARQFPDVPILVNNLGIYETAPFAQIEDADWQRLFEVNVMSGVRLSRLWLPGMKTRNWGRVIFISSESAVNIPAEMIHYGMTKTAQLALARGLAEDCAGTGVTVNAVLPGPTRTAKVEQMVMASAGDGRSFEALEAELLPRMRPSTLLRRFAQPAEVASLVAYLCSPLASATTGAALRVDGGVVRSVL